APVAPAAAIATPRPARAPRQLDRIVVFANPDSSRSPQAARQPKHNPGLIQIKPQPRPGCLLKAREYRRISWRIEVGAGAGGERGHAAIKGGVMSIRKALVTVAVASLATAGATVACQSAPLPTNVAAMKSMIGNDTLQVRWGWGGGIGRGGWGYRSFGY